MTEGVQFGGVSKRGGGNGGGVFFLFVFGGRLGGITTLTRLWGLAEANAANNYFNHRRMDLLISAVLASAPSHLAQSMTEPHVAKPRIAELRGLSQLPGCNLLTTFANTAVEGGHHARTNELHCGIIARTPTQEGCKW